MKGFLALVSILFACAPISAQSNLYTSAAYRFSIELPAGWEISEPGVELNGGVSNNFAVRAVSNGSVINVAIDDWYKDRLNDDQRKSISRNDIDATWNDDNYLKSISEPMIVSIKKAFTNFHLYEQEITMLDGRKAIHVRYSASIAQGSTSVDLMVQTYIQIVGGIQYGISATSSVRNYDKTADIAHKAIYSFHAFPASSTMSFPSPSIKANGLWFVLLRILEKAAPQAIIGAIIASIAILVGVRRATKAKRKKEAATSPEEPNHGA
jgi:hypothetical protein